MKIMKNKTFFSNMNDNLYVRFTSQSLILVFVMTNHFRFDNIVKRVCKYNFFKISFD